MQNKISITIIITTHNEEDNIGELINNINWAKEIIVVDSFSADRTCQIAKELGATIYEREYIGPSDQKNWAIKKAKHRWALILDADERIPSDLQNEIADILKTQHDFDGFWIKRKNYFLGQEMKYGSWRDDKVIRLIDTKTCKYNSKQVHEEIETNGVKIGFLKNKMIHNTYKNIEHFQNKMDRYSRWSAMDYEKKTGKLTSFHFIIKPAFRFIKHYFLQKGFLDGKAGLVSAKIMSWGVFMRYVYLHETRTNKLR